MLNGLGIANTLPGETGNNDTSLCDDLQTRIQNALLSEAVIGTIVKAVADAILETVTSKVYASIDFDIKAKTEQIKDLEKQVKKLNKDVQDFKRTIEEQEQYSRRNCLRFHGIDETADEVTDQVIIKVVKEKLDIDLRPDDLDRSHRMPTRNHQRTGERRPPPPPPPHRKPIIVKFSRYNIRREVYAARFKLRGTNIYVHEDLTRERSDLLFKAIGNTRT